MQRYHAANCTSAVNNSAIGGASARDSGRADSSSIGSYSLNSRHVGRKKSLHSILYVDNVDTFEDV